MNKSAACSCGQLQVTVEGDPMRIALCHCLACQRRTGAVISNQARELCGRLGDEIDQAAW